MVWIISQRNRSELKTPAPSFLRSTPSALQRKPSHFTFTFSVVTYVLYSDIPHLSLDRQTLNKLQRKSAAAICSFSGYESEFKDICFQATVDPRLSEPHLSEPSVLPN